MTVVTAESPQRNEAGLVTMLLDAGVERINVRHPGLRADEMRRLLDSVEPAALPFLSLHDCHELAAEYGTGIHLNSRHPQAPDGFGGPMGRSCHSVSEAAEAKDVDYYFISPVFESISKAGYAPKTSHSELREAFRDGLLDTRAVALGGITAERMPLLKDIGFSGFAVCGYLWEAKTEEEFKKRLKRLCYNS